MGCAVLLVRLRDPGRLAGKQVSRIFCSHSQKRKRQTGAIAQVCRFRFTRNFAVKSLRREVTRQVNHQIRRAGREAFESSVRSKSLLLEIEVR